MYLVTRVGVRRTDTESMSEFDFEQPEGWDMSGEDAEAVQFHTLDVGSERLMDMLRNPNISDIRINSSDRIFFTTETGSKMLGEQIFADSGHYVQVINKIMCLTDAGYTDVTTAQTTFIEGSFRSDRTDIKGSISIATSEVTRDVPAVVIRKQRSDVVTLDGMLDQDMMSSDMRMFLELAVRGRVNMVIAGGTNAGKTTLARALSWFVDPAQPSSPWKKLRSFA